MSKFHIISIIALYIFLKGNFLFSIESDSTQVANKDSIEKKILLFEPLSKHGSLFLINNNGHKYINKRDIQKNDYLDLGDILIQETNMYPLHLGSLGLNNNISFASGLNNQLQFNGISLSDPFLMSNNFGSFSPENTENIEIYTGMLASIFSDNSNSTLINLPEIKYNTSKPYFRFWAADAGDDYLALDGVFSQNISPNINFNLGIRSISGQGVYTNDEVRSRSIRAGLRWNYDSLQNISLIWMHNNHYLDIYGGLSPQSIDENNDFDTDPITAISRFTTNSKRTVNNNAILNYSKLSIDSNSAISSQAYYINNLNYDFTNRTLFSSTFYPDRVKYTTSKLGLNLSYEKNISNLFLKSKIDIHNSSIEDNLYISTVDKFINYSGVVFGKLNLNSFDISTGIRYSQLNNNNLFNYGVNLKFKLEDFQFLIFDYSHSELSPLIIFNNLELEKNNLIYLRYLYQKLSNSLQIDAYYRTIDNMISYNISNNTLEYNNLIDNNSYVGTNLTFKFKIFNELFFTNDEVFTIFKNNLSYPLSDSKAVNPLVHSFIDTYITIPKGRSRADLGFRFSYISENQMPTHLEDLNIFIDNEMSMPASFARNELYIRLRLGQAYLKLTLSNFLGNDYFYVPMYNSLPNNFRMSLNWTF